MVAERQDPDELTEMDRMMLENYSGKRVRLHVLIVPDRLIMREQVEPLRRVLDQLEIDTKGLVDTERKHIRNVMMDMKGAADVFNRTTLELQRRWRMQDNVTEFRRKVG